MTKSVIIYGPDNGYDVVNGSIWLYNGFVSSVDDDRTETNNYYVNIWGSGYIQRSYITLKYTNIGVQFITKIVPPIVNDSKLIMEYSVNGSNPVTRGIFDNTWFESPTEINVDFPEETYNQQIVTIKLYNSGIVGSTDSFQFTNISLYGDPITASPTVKPIFIGPSSDSPSMVPSISPQVSTTQTPTIFPTILPTESPLVLQTPSPTIFPTISPIFIDSPTKSPTLSPTVSSPTLSNITNNKNKKHKWVLTVIILLLALLLIIVCIIGIKYAIRARNKTKHMNKEYTASLLMNDMYATEANKHTNKFALPGETSGYQRNSIHALPVNSGTNGENEPIMEGPNDSGNILINDDIHKNEMNTPGVLDEQN